MGARLVLQVPSADLRRARAVAATDDPDAMKAFAEHMMEIAERKIDEADNVFDHELAILERDQLRARLQLLKRLHVRAAKIVDVDIIADAGAVRRRTIVPENRDLLTLS